MVKSDAYGHGLQAVAQTIGQDADEFAVATADEAYLLSKIIKEKPIQILGCVDRSNMPNYAANVYPTVASADDVDFLKKLGFLGAVNLKVNTGMNRIGCKTEEFDSLASYVKQSGVHVKSVFTHFYNANNIASAEAQFERFEKIVRKYSGEISQFHCCASNFLALPDYMHLNMVRAGIALYGYDDECLLPAMTVVCPVLQVFDVKKGEHVGYGDFTTQNNTKVAAIRVGYGDGYRRKTDLTPRYVSIFGALCPILGQICMDITLIDVSGLDVRSGDSVYLIGEGMSCEALAAAYGTINYEVLTSFSPRAERKYIGQNGIANAIMHKKVNNYLQRN